MKKLKAVLNFLNILGLQKEAAKLEVSQIMQLIQHIVEIIALLVTLMSGGKNIEADNLADDIKQSLKKTLAEAEKKQPNKIA